MMHVENKNIYPQMTSNRGNLIRLFLFLEWAGDACEHHAWQNQHAGAQQQEPIKASALLYSRQIISSSLLRDMLCCTQQWHTISALAHRTAQT